MRPSDSTDTAAAPWADLLPELCGHVVDRLDAFSALRFPAVCKSWAAACEGAPRRLRSGAPTLLTSAPDGDRAATFALNDVSSGKSFHAEAEGLENRWWIGAKDDWLVTMDAGFDIELLNPATGDGVRLPSFTTIPRATIEDDVLCVAPRSVYRFQQVALCRTPAHRDGYLAIAMFDCLLAFTAAGDDCWTTLRNHREGFLTYGDTIAHEGKILAVSLSGHVYSWDIVGTL
ncbi:uncharacterized protein LOC120681360 [Panicum virgatum]|uniref:uncharacterized protein LOC120681360 n=1 Tax=Panicum virgatum TaxID=38727 RepID=UPI0019D5EA86|nr:uncharacterized protein LOC120681360 [Panicum virgatum]